MAMNWVIRAFWAATPPGKRKFLSREEFAALHGAAPEDLQAVVDFAQSHGLEVVETNAARRVVQVSGTVAQVSEAFAVTLYRYEWQGESYRGREGYIHLPNNLADITLGNFLVSWRFRMFWYNLLPIPDISDVTKRSVSSFFYPVLIRQAFGS
jgi:hypothetical protein